MRYIRPSPIDGLNTIRRLETDQMDREWRASLGNPHRSPRVKDNRILVVIPSRNRPEELAKAIDSMIATSDADALCYVDHDQVGMYREALARFTPALDNLDRMTLMRQPIESRVRIFQGPQIGPVAAANQLIHLYRDPYDIYGMIPDDATFVTPGWDRFLTWRMSEFKNRVGVVAAAHNGGEYVNFPWVTREWIDAAGWYYFPRNFHHCCDSIVEMLGECANAIYYARPNEFSMHHELVHTFNRDRFDPDATNFLYWFVGERRDVVRRIREAIER